MKVLLLADILPCKNFPTGLALDQLCRFFPRGSLACFAIMNRFVEARAADDLDWMPVAVSTNRIEDAFRPSSRLVSFPLAWSAEAFRRRFLVPRLAAQAIAFGREQQVELVWAVLRGQTLIQIASEVASGIGVPLVTQVPNAPIWSLIEHRIDRFHRRATLSDFDRAIKASRVCVTASQAMAAEYQKRYGTHCVPLQYGYSDEWSRSPNLEDFPGPTIEIGVSSIYDALEEWWQLLRALNMSGWQVRGRPGARQCDWRRGRAGRGAARLHPPFRVAQPVRNGRGPLDHGHPLSSSSVHQRPRGGNETELSNRSCRSIWRRAGRSCCTARNFPPRRTISSGTRPALPCPIFTPPQSTTRFAGLSTIRQNTAGSVTGAVAAFRRDFTLETRAVEFPARA